MSCERIAISWPVRTTTTPKPGGPRYVPAVVFLLHDAGFTGVGHMRMGLMKRALAVSGQEFRDTPAHHRRRVGAVYAGNRGILIDKREIDDASLAVADRPQDGEPIRRNVLRDAEHRSSLSRSASSACLRSVMSRTEPRTIAPPPAMSTDTSESSQTTDPSGRTMRYSSLCPCTTPFRPAPLQQAGRVLHDSLPIVRMHAFQPPLPGDRRAGLITEQLVMLWTPICAVLRGGSTRRSRFGRPAR